MPSRQIPAFAVTANAPSSRATVTRAPIGSVSTGGSLIEGPGKRERPQRRDLVRRSCRGLGQRGIRNPADIAVAVQLAPGKAFAVAIVDRDALALQRLRRQHGIGARSPRAAARWPRARKIPRRSTKRAAFTLPSRYLAASSRPCRRQARIIHSVRSAACRSRARPGIRRLRGARVLRTASSRRYRHAASSLHRSTKRCRNSAQVIEPAKPPDGALLMSAVFESSQES